MHLSKSSLILSSAMMAATLLVGAAGESRADRGHDHGQQEHHGSQAQGHGGHMDHHSMAGGRPGDPSAVSRTIVLVATDTRFNVQTIQVRDGETVKIVVRNKGSLVHEVTIGDPEMQKMHQAEMLRLMEAGKLTADTVAPGVEHGHPNSVLLEPGESKTIIWTFARHEPLEFACNVPGHYEAGMKGRFAFLN